MEPMQELAYPVVLKPEATGGYVVNFPDFPEALTSGHDQSEALREAADCLAEALAGRMSDGELIPVPSKLKRKQFAVPVPLDIAPKVAIHAAMRDLGLTRKALAGRLRISEHALGQLLDPKHAMKAEDLEPVLRVLGKNLVVSVGDAA